MTEEVPEHTPDEVLAAKACAEAAVTRIQGWKGSEVAVAAFGQAQQTQAALIGIIEWMLHKGIATPSDLGDTMAWAYRKRAAELNAQAEKAHRGESGQIILPDAPAARHRQ